MRREGKKIALLMHADLWLFHSTAKHSKCQQEQ